MDRRAFTKASCGLGLGAALLPRTARAATPLPPAAPLPRPSSGLMRVACAVSENTTEIDYIGPQAVFETWHRDPKTQAFARVFESFTVSHSLEPMSGIVPDYTFETAPAAHVVIVPAQRGSPALVEWLKAVSQTADVTMSVCIGARFLARAGLLDGKRATTHHESIDRFEKEFPQVTWVRDVRFVENEKVSTSGGLTAGIDLALHVVERYYDRATAAFVAEHLEYDGRRWMEG